VGNATTADQLAPVPIDSATTVSVAGGGYHWWACAVTAAPSWGFNGDSQLVSNTHRARGRIGLGVGWKTVTGTAHLQPA
jgi:hypothetical protein